MVVGDVLAVASVFLLCVVFASGVVSLHLCFVACSRRRAAAAQAAASRSGRQSGGTAAAGGGGSTRAQTRRAGGPEAPPPRWLPVKVHRAAPRSEEDDDEEERCAVCLAELADGEEARLLPRCGHGFHAECVGKWLASHSTCPLCRVTVASPDAAPAPAPASALPPLPPEPVSYAASLPAARVYGQGVATVAADRGTIPSPHGTVVLVIEIPELAEPTAIPRDAVKSPSSASPRRLWSFGRAGPGPGPEPSASC